MAAVRFTILLLLVLIPVDLRALEVPELTERVNDYAGMISPAAEAELVRRLRALEEEESTQIVVLTIPSLEGEVIEDYSIRVVDEWKIGQRDRDNGALLLVARDDRELRIEVGYGLEGRLTDLVAGRIVDRVIVPRFARGEVDEGFLAGTDAMIAAVRGEYQAGDMAEEQTGQRGPLLPVLMVLLFIYYFFRQIPRGGRGSGPIVFGGPGGFHRGGFGGGGFSSGGFSGGGGGFGGGGSSGSW
ncbi:TPM domain-containing protein [Prosthecochloris sp. N3]|uniref:TPM domain-containing protein n=1 Tax=Prosthecochloris ethylica TaxID=2743976 RepID=A0ABR9XUN2_9CHLB|nr:MULTISPECIES: TPM domain-containing protein [Prosthecochloris]MBF0585649.1 TPM domain-containing protein [Prosthecochloris ethylica]MBF0637704.1 TPM domain-containing protein [Prosthecochloris ethylica]NUK46858.1 TPM domain-containing protein [Prosthecochloris ethylica]RNA67379.1 TPM domain-containing protein [Prosthecochloris sp. ZM_2]